MTLVLDDGFDSGLHPQDPGRDLHLPGDNLSNSAGGIPHVLPGDHHETTHDALLTRARREKSDGSLTDRGCVQALPYLSSRVSNS